MSWRAIYFIKWEGQDYLANYKNLDDGVVLLIIRKLTYYRHQKTFDRVQILLDETIIQWTKQRMYIKRDINQ